MSVLSQVEYLKKKLNNLENALENKKDITSEELKDLYFQMGKLYSELELMKRVPKYD